MTTEHDPVNHPKHYAARSAAYAAACAEADAAEAAQIKMIAELGNPFRKENDND